MVWYCPLLGCFVVFVWVFGGAAIFVQTLSAHLAYGSISPSTSMPRLQICNKRWWLLVRPLFHGMITSDSAQFLPLKKPSTHTCVSAQLSCHERSTSTYLRTPRTKVICMGIHLFQWVLTILASFVAVFQSRPASAVSPDWLAFCINEPRESTIFQVNLSVLLYIFIKSIQ